MFDIIHKKRPQAGENTNERFPSDMLSRDPHVCTSTKFALVRDQIVLLKYQISGLGVSEYLIHPSVAKKTREREKVSRLYHTQTRARKGEAWLGVAREGRHGRLWRAILERGRRAVWPGGV